MSTQYTHVTRILNGAIQFTSTDSALFLIDAESVAFDNTTGEEVSLERSCSVTTVAFRIAGESLHLDYHFVSPPSQGMFVRTMHDTLAISSRRLEGNHEFTWGINSLMNRSIFLEFLAASALLSCPSFPVESPRDSGRKD